MIHFFIFDHDFFIFDHDFIFLTTFFLDNELLCLFLFFGKCVFYRILLQAVPRVLLPRGNRWKY